MNAICSGSCLSRVVRLAVEAFLSHKMELNMTSFSAVIAQNPNLHVKGNAISLRQLNKPHSINTTQKIGKQWKLTILFWYDSGIGVAAISMSNFSQTFDISQTDFEHRGHAYLIWNTFYYMNKDNIKRDAEKETSTSASTYW